MSRLQRTSRIDEATVKVPCEDQTPPQNDGCPTKIRSVPFSARPVEDDYPHWTFDDLSPLQGQDEIKDWLQTITLRKNDDYAIGPDVLTVRMGLGWDRGADVDASVALFDEFLRCTDIVWYRNLKSKCGSVKHSGDNLTGIGGGDDETILVQLSDIPLHVHYLLFAVCVYSFNLSFKDVRSAYVRMMDGKTMHHHNEMFRFPLTDMSGHAMILGVLARKGPLWNFKALGTPATGRTMMELLQNDANLRCLSEIQCWKPKLRHVTVNVIRGKNLAAKDSNGFFRPATSDPYFTVQFRKKTFKSEYLAKTLNPQWKACPFEVGFLTEVEVQPLIVKVFDYDMLSADDFMGAVAIPGHALYALGPGQHTYWFMLSSLEKKTHGSDDISGSILMHITVQEAQGQNGGAMLAYGV